MYKVLFLVQLPPPIHGASAVNLSIKNSAYINNSFSTKYFNISPAKDLTDIGKFSIGKIFKLAKIFIGVINGFIEFKPNLVYITLSPHGLAFYKDALIALTIKSLGGKIVYHLHGKGIEKQTRTSWIKNKIYRHVFNKAHVIHLSEKLYFDIDTIRDPSTTITAVQNGINGSAFIPIKKNNPVLTFVYLSNFIPAKGADILIRATALIDKKYSDSFKVKLIGKPSNSSYFQELKALITTDLEQKISIIGPKYGTDKIRELLTSDVFVLPTKNDCFPLSILEAMAAGLPVISTDEGAIADIVDHGITGDIITDINPHSLAAAMTKYLQSRSYSEDCAEAATAKYNLKYTQEIFEQNLVSTLKTLIEQR